MEKDKDMGIKQFYESLLATHPPKRLKTDDIEERKRKQREYSKRYYEKKKAKLAAQGLTTYSKKNYDSEKRKAQYQKQKAEGTLKNYYKEAKAKDPLYNQKAHIRRKARDVNWQTVKGNRNNFSTWLSLVEFIRESDTSKQELAQQLSDDWWVYRKVGNTKSAESKTVYRPRITNTVMTAEQIDELDNYALKQGLTSQHELIRSTVSYYGELKDIDSREDDKEVDVWTVQERDKDYSEDEKAHKVRYHNGSPEHGSIVARRIRQLEMREKDGD